MHKQGGWVKVPLTLLLDEPNGGLIVVIEHVFNEGSIDQLLLRNYRFANIQTVAPPPKEEK